MVIELWLVLNENNDWLQQIDSTVFAMKSGIF